MPNDIEAIRRAAQNAAPAYQAQQQVERLAEQGVDVASPFAFSRSREARAETVQEKKVTTLSFTPETVIPPQVDPQGGISLQELDGGNHPVHSRGVSIRTPEIIGMFDFMPIFSGQRLIGDSRNPERLLTDSGKFIDTQINARKLRIDDISNLFNQLALDLDSPTGKITQNMIDVLEGKITETKEDFKTIEGISNSVILFLDALNLRNPSPALAQKFLQNRSRRFEENPLLLPEEFRRAMDFRNILQRNHGFTDNKIDQFSGTKLFLYFLYDLRSLLKGPIEPPDGGFGTSLTRRRDFIPRDRNNFKANAGTGKGRLYAVPLIDVTDGYGRGDFGFGRCSLMFSEEAGTRGESPEDDDPSFTQDFGYEDNNVRAQKVLINKDHLYHNGVLGQAPAILASAICSDLSFSSAIGNDDFISRFNQSFPGRSDIPPQSKSKSISDRIVSPIPSYQGVGNARGAAGLVNSDKSLTGAVFYDDPGGNIIDVNKPIKVFDPDEPGPIRNGIQQIITNTPYNKLLKPVLSTLDQGDNIQAEPLRDFIGSVPSRLSAAADSMDYFFATDDNVLNPRALLMRILKNIKNRIPDLNITGQLSEDTSMTTGPAIDFCILAQGYRDANLPTRFQLPEAQAGAVNMYRTNDLLTMFITSLAKAHSNKGKYAEVIPVADESGSINWPNMSLRLANIIRLNCFNAFRGISNQEDNDDRGAWRLLKNDASNNLKAYPANTRGVSEASWPGSTFSRSRAFGAQLYPDWGKIYEKGEEKLENTLSHGGGQLLIPHGHGGRTRGGLYGIGNLGLLRFEEGNASTPVKVFNSHEIQSRLRLVSGEAYSRSIFKDIVNDLDTLYQAATARGPVVDRNTGRMISSGVDPSYLASFVLSIYGHIISQLLTLRFDAQSIKTRNNQNINPQYDRCWRGQADGFSRYGAPAVMYIRNIVKAQEFIEELNNFIDNDIDPDPGSSLGLFLAEFNRIVGHQQSVTLDSIDFFRALSNQIQSSGENFLSSFVNDENEIRVDDSFERVKDILPLAIQPTQVISMKNQLLSVDSKEGMQRYFDDFMIGTAQENFMYSLLSDTGPNRFRNEDIATRVQNLDFNSEFGSNMQILSVGIPQGFTESVLEVNSVNNPEAFSERLVDIYVFARDHVLGDRITIYPGKWTFDLSVFFDSVSDPIESNNETRPEIATQEGINFYNSVVGRPFPSAEEALTNNVSLRRIKMENGDVEIVTRPEGLADAEVFDNHVYDFLAKTYIKITTGMELSEQSFLLNQDIEGKNAADPDLANLRSLMNTHLSQLLGKEVTFDDFLGGNRKFRELFNRLSKGERTSQLIDEVDAKLKGATKSEETLSSEDMVTFSRMISPNNPIVTPGLMREKSVSPRVFERVFCMFIDPDKMAGQAPFNSPSTALNIRREGGNKGRRAGLSQLPCNSSNLYYDEIQATRSQDSTPRGGAYEVLIVPHGTEVISENTGELSDEFRDA